MTLANRCGNLHATHTQSPSHSPFAISSRATKYRKKEEERNTIKFPNNNYMRTFQQKQFYQSTIKAYARAIAYTFTIPTSFSLLSVSNFNWIPLCILYTFRLCKRLQQPAQCSECYSLSLSVCMCGVGRMWSSRRVYNVFTM